MKEPLSFENVLLLIIVVLSYGFLAFAYYTTTDLTIKGVILTAIIGTLGVATNWRFGGSKSSTMKDSTIKSLQENANTATTIKTDTVNAENVEVVNTENINTK